MEYIAGTTFKVGVTFPTSDVPPAVGSVVYTIRDQDGTPLAGHTEVAVTTDGTTTSIVVDFPSSITAITAEFEKRTLEVHYEYAGVSKRIVRIIRLVPFLNLGITETDVREWLGVNDRELPESEIDLVAAYFEVKEDLSTLDAALVAGGRTEVAANTAVKMKAAINIIPSLKLRVAQKESDGPITFDRPDLSTFDDLMAYALEAYSEALDELGRAEPPSGIFEIVVRPDPFLGG